MAAGYREQAADLFRDAEHWQPLAQIVTESAQELFQQGRCHMLETWLLAMPEDYRNANPWLRYWLGFLPIVC